MFVVLPALRGKLIRKSGGFKAHEQHDSYEL